VRAWNLLDLEAPGGTRDPIVLHSTGEGRLLLVVLNPGQQLGEHEVKENAYVAVVNGSVRVETGDEIQQAGPGTLFRFDPGERRTVASDEGARILLFLAPWPGEGHYRGGDGP
jgi:quercetin dioxygenase-like cupin family protein